MNKYIEDYVSNVSDVLEVVEETLNETVTDTNNVQVPQLLAIVAGKLNLTEDQIKGKDAIIRDYIHNNPNWEIFRGKKGGIGKPNLANAKAKSAKKAAKADIEKEILAKIMVTETEEDSLD